MDDDVSAADEVKVHGMDWQAQESGIEQDVGQVTHNGLCVTRLRGTDLVLTGEIDLRNADEIEAHILSWLHDADNYLDCTGVDFMDSMGLTMILRVRALAVQRGACLHVICSPTVHLVFAMAGLTEPFPGLTVTRGDSN